MSVKEIIHKLLRTDDHQDGAKPLELKRGSVYAIECDDYLSPDSLADIESYLSVIGKRTGCEFVILDRGLHIATAEPKEE